MKYPKIQSVYKRDPATKFRTFLSEMTYPEFFYLRDCRWAWTEKVDGTNIRFTFEDGEWKIGGRTDRAQIPTHLLGPLMAIKDRLGDEFPEDFTVFGEGYGAKIQKVGSCYIPDGTDFVLFDVWTGNRWLSRDEVKEFGLQNKLKVVPIVGSGTIDEAVEFVRGGFDSAWGPFEAEGLVIRPLVELNRSSGERIITKVKVRDFAH